MGFQKALFETPYCYSRMAVPFTASQRPPDSLWPGSQGRHHPHFLWSCPLGQSRKTSPTAYGPAYHRRSVGNGELISLWPFLIMVNELGEYQSYSLQLTSSLHSRSRPKWRIPKRFWQILWAVLCWKIWKARNEHYMANRKADQRRTIRKSWYRLGMYLRKKNDLIYIT